MEKTIFEITKMDCPSEENLIRMKLDGISSIKNLDFDIPNRKLTIFHNGQIEQIEKSIIELNLGGQKLQTELTDQTEFSENSNQKKLLWTVLAINFSFFIIEMTTGLISKSMGLVADSLDMLADSFVYGISLFAVGGTLIRKKRIAKLAGYFQITLAIIGFIEVLRRFLGAEKLPDFSTMIIVSIFALIANGICLYLMQKSKSKEEAHMKASLIFTSNDIIINLGVITAGFLMNWLNSNKPDLIKDTTETYFDIDNHSNTVRYRTSQHRNDRLMAQDGFFLWQPIFNQPLEIGQIFKFRIPASKKVHILNELYSIGYTSLRLIRGPMGITAHGNVCNAIGINI